MTGEESEGSSGTDSPSGGTTEESGAENSLDVETTGEGGVEPENLPGMCFHVLS